MAGFYVSNFEIECECKVWDQRKCTRRAIEDEKYVVRSNTGSKFIDDKLFCKTSESILIIDGIILNKSELIASYAPSSESWEKTVERMKFENKFYFEKFRGNFSGACYNCNDDVWTFFTDHIGDHPVFYYCKNGKFIVSTDLNWLVEVLRAAHQNISLDEYAFRSLLSCGWICRDNTIISEVKRLLPGSCITIKDGSVVSVDRYYSIVNDKLTTQNEGEIIEEVDKRFRNAVRLEYEKDKEGGYAHMVTLSGGLDSRMNVWCAHELGYSDITVITFGQNGSSDIQIASEIASTLHFPHMIKTLDDAKFLSDIPETVKRTFGMLNVQGVIHGQSIIKLLNREQYGILHTGRVGDGILTSHWEYHRRPSGLVGALNQNIRLIPYEREYANEELYFLNEHEWHCTLGGSCADFEEASYASPFLDIDFMDYCLSIPLRYRYNYRIYKKWILRKYPEAAEFIWEKTGGKISDSNWNLKVRKYQDKIKRNLNQVSFENLGMNPFEYWYSSIPSAREKLENMYSNLLGEVQISSELRNIVCSIYRNADCRQKIEVISALQSVKEYLC